MITDRQSSGLSARDAEILFGHSDELNFGQTPEEPATSTAVATVSEPTINMTGEQFAWHVRAMMYGLLYLRRTLVRWIEQYPVPGGLSYDQIQALSEFLELPIRGEVPPAGSTLGVERMREVLAFIDEDLWHLGIVWGEDWEVVFIDHKNVVALGYRMGKMDRALMKQWYVSATTTLNYGFAILKMDLNYRFDIAMSIEGHWSRINEISLFPIAMFSALVDLAASWAAGIASALGGALGVVGEGLMAGLWKAVKPLIFPAILIGGVGLTGMYLWRKHHDKFLPPQEEQEEMLKVAAKVAPLVV